LNNNNSSQKSKVAIKAVGASTARTPHLKINGSAISLSSDSFTWKKKKKYHPIRCSKKNMRRLVSIVVAAEAAKPPGGKAPPPGKSIPPAISKACVTSLAPRDSDILINRKNHK
jgi:hypothetical protein